MKKEDEEIFDFDEFKLEKQKESILEKKYKKLMNLRTDNGAVKEKNAQEKIILFSYGLFLGGFYGISLGITLSLYFSLRYKTMFKKQFYLKSGIYSGLIFGITMAFYSVIFFEPNKIKENLKLGNYF